MHQEGVPFPSLDVNPYNRWGFHDISAMVARLDQLPTAHAMWNQDLFIR